MTKKDQNAIASAIISEIEDALEYCESEEGFTMVPDVWSSISHILIGEITSHIKDGLANGIKSVDRAHKISSTDEINKLKSQNKELKKKLAEFKAIDMMIKEARNDASS